MLQLDSEETWIFFFSPPKRRNIGLARQLLQLLFNPVLKLLPKVELPGIKHIFSDHYSTFSCTDSLAHLLTYWTNYFLFLKQIFCLYVQCPFCPWNFAYEHLPDGPFIWLGLSTPAGNTFICLLTWFLDLIQVLSFGGNFNLRKSPMFNLQPMLSKQ